MNDYISGKRKAIPAVLVYAFQRKKVLMIHRNVKGKKDFQAGKWNGLGGKCEPDESPLQAARREFLEESGIKLPLSSFEPCGVLQFPNFRPLQSEDWIVFLFRAKVPASNSKHSGSCSEGDLHWVSAKNIFSLNLWPGDHKFLPYVFKAQPIVGTLWYERKKLLRYWIKRL